jgi:predicted ABC-type transport system involved in lysophospholipase L1 biosynthesis ATPase subunit
MNMLSGIYFPDEGQIFINDEEVKITSPKIAFDHGIGMIHQHFKLVDVLTAAENIVLGLNDGSKFDLKKASEKIRSICEMYGFEVDPAQKIYDMSVSQKQTVEIVKVLYRGADILILDEPTAVLTPQETDRLFAVLRNMRRRKGRSNHYPQAPRGGGHFRQSCHFEKRPVCRRHEDERNECRRDDQYDGRTCGISEYRKTGSGRSQAENRGEEPHCPGC